MQVLIRDWDRADVSAVGSLWLEALGETDLEGMVLYADAERRLRSWLLDRVRERSGVGLVAEVDGMFGGFLLGRVGEWDSVPPILRPQRIGLVDVVCVEAQVRRQGIGMRLVEEALERMRSRGAVRVETTYQVRDGAAVRLWERMQFHPCLERAWKRA